MKTAFALCSVATFALAGVAHGWTNAGDFSWEANCDFVGNDLYNERQPNEMGCGSVCAKQYPKCTHYVWTDYNGGTCWYKKDWPGDKLATTKHGNCGYVNHGRRDAGPSSSGGVPLAEGAPTSDEVPPMQGGRRMRQ
ncbi:TPA: hypothetical protein N0F65_006308 [Lagenidium giganteum]|uniref:Apple domain-containing protein n=1 Tax=Lagenidium giganteum TaxID=4803 RepID=A0AAV2YNR2_9STRA|nr:TPA: hypothetical protein N0F65_006308 [Lagenidium giganteum]